MGVEEKERQEIEAYLNRHHLQDFLGDTVNDVVKERPKDPLVKLADALRACSDSSRQIQGVEGRQILNGEALPALELEIRTCQGSFYGTVSSGPYDEEENRYEGKGLLRAIESVDRVLAELIEGKDPSQQAMLDNIMAMEPSLPKNVISAASIACCKAGAKQTLISAFEHVAVISNNSEGATPAPAFSIINGGHSSSSSLWVQDIIIMPTGERTFADKLLVASTIHRTLEEVARNAGQETLQRGPRGGFCNGAGTFDQLMDSLVTALDAAGCLGSVEIIIDVHASRLVARESTETVATGGQEEETTSYNLATFKSDKTGVDLLSTAEGLLDMYLEWLEKYPVTAFVEPFAPTDVSYSKELLNRGNQILLGKTKKSTGEGSGANQAGNEGQPDPMTQRESEGEGGSSGSDNGRLKVIADESVLTPAQLVFLDEQRGANTVLVNIAKTSTVSETIALAGKANEVGWSVIAGAASEEELEGEFIAHLAVGLRAEALLMGGLRSVGAIQACSHLTRIDSMGVQFVGTTPQ